MSGPVDETVEERGFGVNTIEVREGRATSIGKLGIIRVLPTKRRRTIGPWCFVDLMSGGDFAEPPPMEIGPHPHIGLSTVTWIFEGSALHSDSLGTEQLIRPGELNLMTSGRGIAHAELGIDTISPDSAEGTMGVQMWIAQPEETRHGESRFEHLNQLPRVDLNGGEAQVLVGSFRGHTSPAIQDHPAVGLDLQLGAPLEIELETGFEHGVIPIDRPVKVNDEIVDTGSLAIVSEGLESIRLETRSGSGRLLLLGGKPLGEPVKMWWNFVARTTDEITEAWDDWENHNEDRFGPVPSELARIDAPRPPWVKPPG
ncbi:MAG: pirin family protein [Acidimicrobiia bacterium]